MNISFLENEVWYAAVSEFGSYMPLDNTCKNLEVKLINNITYNQMTPLLLSNKGRVLYKEDGFIAIFNENNISLDRDVILTDTKDSLKSAFLYARDNFIKKDDNKVTDEFIKNNIYNTWMYSPFEVTQEKVLSYAKQILEDGLETGIIIIDDKWNKNYGDWIFDKDKFENPKEMIDKLHNMGFLVMLWICPYIDFDSDSYSKCVENDYLLKDNDEIFKLKWWNGTSACFDFRKKEVQDYWREILSDLQKLGVDGFKFDGGDSMYYKAEHQADLQCYLWAKFASEYKYNELRAGYNTGALPLFERLSDKRHSWVNNGIKTLIPSALALGLSGHFLSSPDMIGGGEVKDIINGCLLKKDIYLAHTQVALLMPNMQFSILPKVVLEDDYIKFLDLLKVRKCYIDYILDLYNNTDEPIVRSLEYEFPDAGYEYEQDVFMLGSKYLVVPVTKENQVEKEIKLPKGTWKYGDEVYKNRENIRLKLSLDKLLVLEKLED